MIQDKRKALGRGLETLLPAARGAAAAVMPPRDGAGALADGRASEIALDKIDRNPYQTRSKIREDALNELAASIKANGVMQPIVVRPASDRDPDKRGRYQLITGERRWLASQRAGKKTIPAIVREASDQQALEMTIIENLQREDLGPMEQARAFDRLSHEFGLTQEQISQHTGKDRTSIANYIRLLKLPAEVQRELEQNLKLTFSHAKQLLMLESDQQILYVAKQIVEKELSVGQTEALVIELRSQSGTSPTPSPLKSIDPNVRAAEEELARMLGTRVRIKDRRGRGTILVEYASVEEFERIVEAMSGKA